MMTQSSRSINQRQLSIDANVCIRSDTDAELRLKKLKATFNFISLQRSAYVDVQPLLLAMEAREQKDASSMKLNIARRARFSSYPLCIIVQSPITNQCVRLKVKSLRTVIIE